MSSRVYSRMLSSLLTFVSGLGPAPVQQFKAPSHRAAHPRRARQLAACVACVALGVGVAPPSYAQTTASPPAASDEPQTAAQLFSRFTTLTGLEATFVEVKKLALLKQPLTSEGTLYYMRPGYLLRQVHKPKATRVLITPDKLELKDDQGSRQIDLRARPDVKLFVESFTKVLAGDEAALARGFDIAFTPRPQTPATPNEDVWRLTLTPKTSPLDKLVSKLVLSGKGYAVELIEVFETKGDSSRTTLRVAKVGRQFTASEKQALFGIGPSAPAQ